MRTAEVTLPAAVSSVPAARHFTESVLVGWGLESLAWGATVIVSELATNAALHARGAEFHVRVLATGSGEVQVEVSDGSSRMPRQRSYSSEATTGRGLRMVENLSADWGARPEPAGKTVWARLAEGAPGTEEDVDQDALLDAFDELDGPDRVPAHRSDRGTGTPATSRLPAAG